MATKKCSKCGEEKDISDFYINSCGKIPPYCKVCDNKRKKIYQKNLPIEVRKDRNKEKYKKQKHTLDDRHRRYKAHAKKNGWPFEIPKEKFAEITSQHCYYCGKFTKGTNFTGIDRICSDKGYIPGNVRPCCSTCNTAKSNHTTNEYIQQCKDVVNYQRKMRKKGVKAQLRK